MADGGSVTIRAILDDSDVQQGVRRVKNELDNVGKGGGFDPLDQSARNAGSALSDLATKAKNGIYKVSKFTIKAAAGLTAVVKGAVLAGGISRAMKLDEAEAKFHQLGMDVDGMMKSVNDSVKGTRYSLDQMAGNAVTLGAAGVKAGDDMTAALKSVASVASISGADLQSIGGIYTKVAATGHVTGRVMQQLMMNGINANAALQKALGKSADEINDMVSAGEIDFKTFADAMYAYLGDASESANSTFSGAMANLKAAASRLGAKFASPVLEGLRQVAVDSIPAIDELSESLDPLVKRFEEWLNGTANSKGAIEKTTDAVKAFTDALGHGKGVLQAIKDGITAGFGAEAAKNVEMVAKALVAVMAAAPAIKIFDMGKSGFEFFKQMKKEAAEAGGLLKSLKGGLIGLGVAAGVAVAAFAFAKYKEAKRYTENLHKATDGLRKAYESGKQSAIDAYDALSKGADDTERKVGRSHREINKSVSNLIDSQADLSDRIQQGWKDYETNNILLGQYATTIENLAGKQNLSSEEQGRLTSAVEGFNSITGESLEVIDAANGKISESIDWIDKHVEKYREEALAAKYSADIQELAQQQVLDQQEYAAAVQDANLAAQGIGYDDLASFMDAYSNASGTELEYMQKKYDMLLPYITAMNQSKDAYDSVTATLGEYQSALGAIDYVSAITSNGELGAALAEAGVDAEALAVKMKDAGVSADALAGMAPEQAAQVASAWMSMGDQSKEAFNKLVANVGKGIEDSKAKADKDTPVVGNALIEGAVRGVDEMAQKLSDSYVAATLQAVQDARNAIESKSPSKLTKRVIGKPMAEGAAVGIEDETPRIAQAFESSVVDAVSAAQMASKAVLSQTSPVDWYSTSGAFSGVSMLSTNGSAAATSSYYTTNNAAPIYNTWINDARVNDDREIEEILTTMLTTLKRKTEML